MEKNLHVFQSISEAIDGVQKERGRTVLFLGGANPLAHLDAARGETDQRVGKMAALLSGPGAGLPDLEVCRRLPDRLRGLRAAYGRTNLLLSPRAAQEYTALVAELLEAEARLAETKAAPQFATALTTSRTLEIAKEKSGQLRATASGMLALDRALSTEDFAKLVRLSAEVNGSLASPGLLLAEAERARLQAFRSTPHWQAVDSVLGKLLANAFKGEFGVSPDHFFDVISLKMKDLDALRRGEVEGVLSQAAAELAAATRSLVGLSAAMTLLLGTSVVLGWKMTREIRQTARGLTSSAAEMSTAATRVATNVQDTAGRMSTVAAAAEESSSTTISVAASMEQASTNLTSVAGATEELNATTTEIASSTERARKISDEAAVNGSITEIRTGGEQVQGSASRVAELARQLSSLVARFKLEH